MIDNILIGIISQIPLKFANITKIPLVQIKIFSNTTAHKTSRRQELNHYNNIISIKSS
jgi:hypothetical protein